MKSKLNLGLLLVAFVCVLACGPKKENNETETADTTAVSNEPKEFGEADGKKVSLYTLKNSHGVEAHITNYGGIITSLMVPDKTGKLEDVVLGYDNLADYQKDSPYFGALIGRYGNRIAKGKFTLDGEEYTLAVNNGVNTLHGGKKGFDKVVWDAEKITTDEGEGLKLNYVSPDMEEGYPGELKVEVTYVLTDDNSLKIDYTATTDKKTIVNLTNHSYFNLTGGVKGDILGHEVMINADKFVPIDSTLIPEGQLESVDGTPFDFREPTAIGARIGEDNQQLTYGGGYDHCWVLNADGEGMTKAASVYEPKSGRLMEIFTTEPGLQFYSGNFLDGSLTGKGGVAYKYRWGIALETEHYPDSPNQPDFPSVELNPGETYHTSTTYKFSTK
ncbi:aldose epimerase family protein [Fulvivirga ligni]|uniref:aldose epimerase family protein n=1 Tax=Fulvivirga ligni TaxID=2904246 RepID=UPI001F1EB9CB|nr:aldose epimerase family protein [Fulvivirga ligni]UII21468.1 galactose mutarotase [Fulvivirga ligni]